MLRNSTFGGYVTYIICILSILLSIYRKGLLRREALSSPPFPQISCRAVPKWALLSRSYTSNFLLVMVMRFFLNCCVSSTWWKSHVWPPSHWWCDSWKLLKKNREKFNVLNFSWHSTSLLRSLCEGGYTCDFHRALVMRHFWKIASASQAHVATALSNFSGENTNLQIGVPPENTLGFS